MRLSGHALLERSDQAGLADAGLAGDEHHLSFALLCLPPAAQQQVELVLAPDQRREGGRVHGLEAALNHGLAQHLPGAAPGQAGP